MVALSPWHGRKNPWENIRAEAIVLKNRGVILSWDFWLESRRRLVLQYSHKTIRIIHLRIHHKAFPSVHRTRLVSASHWFYQKISNNWFVDCLEIEMHGPEADRLYKIILVCWQTTLYVGRVIKFVSSQLRGTALLIEQRRAPALRAKSDYVAEAACAVHEAHDVSNLNFKMSCV